MGPDEWITIGRAISECLTVVHTWVDLEANRAQARIISARKTRKFERQWYEEGL